MSTLSNSPLPITTSATATATTDRRRRRRFSLSKWKGAKLIPLAISLAIGILFRFAVPKPHQLSTKAWQLLAIFLTTICGLIVSPLPVGAWAFLCLTIAVITKTLTFAAAFAAFTNEVIWLIVVSFFFSRGFIKTGLGDRVALCFVSWLGKNTLGLSYGLALSEAAISSAIPSTTARAGGIFLPIIKSLAVTADSHPKDDSSKKLGAYLIQAQLQASNSSSALFLTAAANNLLCLKLAEGLGVKTSNKWLTWFKVSSLPAIISLLASPAILYKIFPPEMKNTPDAPLMARRKLEQMGPIKSDQWVMMIVMLVTVALWISGEALGLASVITAMLGLSLLLAFGILTWDDCLTEKSAWDTLAWFGVLIGMATQLTTLGVVAWMSNVVANFLNSLSLHWFGAFCILLGTYYFIHYLFASQTAHVAALYPAFLGMCLASKIPSLLATLLLGYFSNLFGALTHYSSGQAAVYYGAGYVELRDVFKMGITIALINIAIWGLVGAGWWKILGLY
ncbi:dicarboxylate transporter 2.1, chloroplastic-like [Nicotiana tabacum]|uniref:Dicarboxylate transporter 2.1, chloroplastic-like n=1 Tax=Nicotiana tabacum TaxID=4097 RepID=A0A1S4CRW8_TOBAC|nr:dicarboxylate transporter 2.1, chloroplastic-like [Nicotiana tomentosiformis]XP_016503821.1 PREDICTED: dicarboxylate transporter 2.1, chloroplastic-like [Nicotiana tabacum]XP_033509556.1 dicarboxylate transporter 2.1, chloroplastic-like [Nicotiana tomentosiformis]